MTTATQMKCACESCLCVVSLTDAVMNDGKAYCGEACASGHASGHASGSCCGHAGCSCYS